jgi:hypothetical protein
MQKSCQRLVASLALNFYVIVVCFAFQILHECPPSDFNYGDERMSPGAGLVEFPSMLYSESGASLVEFPSMLYSESYCYFRALVIYLFSLKLQSSSSEYCILHALCLSLCKPVIILKNKSRPLVVIIWND